MINHLPNINVLYTVYLVYKCLTFDLHAIQKLILMNIYLKFFCKKNQIYLKFLKYLNPANYFNSFKLVLQSPVNESGCLYTIHPHSIFCFGIRISVADINSPFSRCVFVGASSAINMAPHGILTVMQGYQKATAENIKQTMQQRKSIVLQPGGFKESVIANHKENRIILANRKGFVKLALQYGYALCPGFIFQEQKSYMSSDALQSFRLKFTKYQIPSALFISKCGPFPNPNIDITVVVGKPIQLPKIVKPTREEVNKYHLIYTNALIDLFNQNVSKYDPGATLVIYDEPKL